MEHVPVTHQLTTPNLAHPRRHHLPPLLPLPFELPQHARDGDQGLACARWRQHLKSYRDVDREI